jgi:deoxyribodipyrimidine photo-lyase
MQFPVRHSDILDRIDSIDPIAYGRTRNDVDGAVTYLSPYISRGVISTRRVLDTVMAKGFGLHQVETFAKELAWRDYFQRIWQHANIDEDLKGNQDHVLHQEVPEAVVVAQTGIQGIDEAIRKMYDTGYMHNHCRMYVASVACNIGGAHWRMPARWMYYHLIDGDWGSNACSWQWVAGSKNGKKYFANQENINRYTHTQQKHTFLDVPYEEFPLPEVPDVLARTMNLLVESSLPASGELNLHEILPVFVYNYYNLDPDWHAGEEGHRILLLEPDVFQRYPVSEKCMDFMMAMAENIPGIQVFTGSFHALKEKFSGSEIIYREHPLNIHYLGRKESREWICEEVTGTFPSFFSYWKKIEKHLQKRYG